MENLQYIGARYVPKFYKNPDDQSNNWKQDDFEALTIVTYLNDSYTSKVPVPHTVGNPADNPQYWACTTKYTAAVAALQNSVALINEDIDAIKNSIVTPQMFGAVGDGFTDDTAAFNALSNVNACIFIPKADYNINQSITLNNVVSDLGSYTNYKPMYAKELKLPLRDLAWIKTDILLNTNQEYEESACRIGNKYYVITNEFTNNSNGILVYDLDWNLESHYSVSKTTIGTCNSCSTDGVFLYIDFDNGYHYKYNVDNLNTPLLAVNNSNYRNTCYYNKQLYAIQIDATEVKVSKLNATLDVLSDTWSVANTRYTLQSATIFNGQVYITTTDGNFTVIDIVSHEVLNVPYYQGAKEIEAFFEDDGKLYSVGHLMSVGGIFNVGSFDGGIDLEPINVYEIDASATRFAVTTIAPRSGIYHVVNGKTAGVLPLNDCIVEWFGKNLVCYSIADNAKYAYIGGIWEFVGTFKSIGVQVDGNKFMIYLLPDGQVYAYLRSYRVQNANSTSYSNTFSVDLSPLYELKGWADNVEREMLGVARQYGPLTSGNVYAYDVRISKTSVSLGVRRIEGSNADLDALLIGTLELDAD